MAAKPRTSRRQIAELAFVVRALLVQFETAGVKNTAGHRAALDAADAFVRGEQVSTRAIRTARDGVQAERARYGVTGATLYAKFCALPIDALLTMVERGDDESAHILTYAAQSVPNTSWAGGTARLESLRAEAAAHASAIDDSPLTLRKKTVNARTQATESALLERSRAALSGVALTVLDEVGPARDGKLTTTRDALTKRLRKLDFPVSEAVLEFEETFGGLLLPVSRFDHWRDDRLYTLIGPWAGLGSHTTVHPRGGRSAATSRLTPVAYGPQDDVYFLDEQGAAWYHETIGEPGAVPFGATGTELVTRLAIAALTYASKDRTGTPVFPRASDVASACAALGLTRLFIDDASEWWAGPAAVVVRLRDQTWGIARTEEAVAALREQG